MARVVVVGTHPLAVRIAAMTDGGLVWSSSDLRPGDKVIKIVSKPEEVAVVARAVGEDAMLAAVIAWQLPEQAIAELLKIPVPCLIGEPTLAQLASVLEDGEDRIDRNVESAQAKRYAVLEQMLEEPTPQGRQERA